MVRAQSPISEFDDSDGPLKKAIIFHEDRTILIAEKFNNVQFLLPFLKFSVSIKAELANLLQVLQTMWDMPTYTRTAAASLVSLELAKAKKMQMQ